MGKLFSIARTAALIIAAILLSIFVAMNIRPAPVFEGADGYIFYTGSTSADCREVRCTQESAAAVKTLLGKIGGECAEYEHFDLDKFMNKVGAKVLFREITDDSVNYYCSAPLPYSITLYGKRVNLHVSMRAECAKVGTPIIFGGY